MFQNLVQVLRPEHLGDRPLEAVDRMAPDEGNDRRRLRLRELTGLAIFFLDILRTMFQEPLKQVPTLVFGNLADGIGDGLAEEGQGRCWLREYSTSLQCQTKCRTNVLAQFFAEAIKAERLSERATEAAA